MESRLNWSRYVSGLLFLNRVLIKIKGNKYGQAHEAYRAKEIRK